MNITIKFIIKINHNIISHKYYSNMIIIYYYQLLVIKHIYVHFNIDFKQNNDIIFLYGGR